MHAIAELHTSLLSVCLGWPPADAGRTLAQVPAMTTASSIVRKREADGPDLAAERKHKKPYKLTATAFPDDTGSQMTVGAFRRILSLEGRVRHFIHLPNTRPFPLRWWSRPLRHDVASGTRALIASPGKLARGGLAAGGWRSGC